MRFVLFVFSALFFQVTFAFAQANLPPDPFLNQLTGQWILRGNIDNQETTHDVTATWILNNLYLCITEVSREKDKDGKPLYEALVLLGRDGKSGDYQCLWLDITGGGGLNAQSIGLAIKEGNSIPFLFRDPSGKVSFRNTFVFEQGTSAWRWEMDNILDSQAVPFARVHLTRE